MLLLLRVVKQLSLRSRACVVQANGVVHVLLCVLVAELLVQGLQFPFRGLRLPECEEYFLLRKDASQVVIEAF